MSVHIHYVIGNLANGGLSGMASLQSIVVMQNNRHEDTLHRLILGWRFVLMQKTLLRSLGKVCCIDTRNVVSTQKPIERIVKWPIEF